MNQVDGSVPAPSLQCHVWLSSKTVAKHGHLSHEDQKLRKAYFLAQMLKKNES